MLILALLLAAQEGDLFIVPEELLDGGGLELTEEEKPSSAVPS